MIVHKDRIRVLPKIKMTVLLMPEIRVYKNGKESSLINWLMDQGFSPGYDANNSMTMWDGEHRFYTFDCDEFSESTTQESSTDLMIAFVVGVTVTLDQWCDILDYLNNPESPGGERANQFLGRPKFEKPTGDLPTYEPYQPPPVSTEYSFRYEVFEGGFLYEVIKPNTDRPYTVWEQDTTSHLNFFSSLFSIDSWGVSKDDYAFLNHAWKELFMPHGLCDLDKLVKDRVRACERGAEQPRVYRKSLLELKSDLLERKVEIGTKRSRIDDGVSRKK